MRKEETVKKFIGVISLLLAFMPVMGICDAEVAEKKSIWSKIFGEKPEHWVEIGGGFGLGSNATSKFQFSDPVLQAAIEQYLKVKNVTPLGAMVNLGVNVTSKISLNVDHLFSSAQQSVDITGSAPSKAGPLNIDSSPVVSVHYSPVSFWRIKPYLGVGMRKLSLSGQQDYVKYTKFESSELNTIYEVGVKVLIFWRILGSIDYKRSEPVNLDTDIGFAHQKTTLGSDLISASVHIALF